MIRLENVHEAYGDPVLRGVSLNVPAECIYALIGPGAAGKSVLLETVAGLIRPEEGHVFVDGEDITAMTDLELAETRKKIGMLFQNYALFDHGRGSRTSWGPA